MSRKLFNIAFQLQARYFNRVIVKRTSHLMICGVFLLGLLGCDQVYRVLDEEGAQEKDLVGEIVPFEENTKIKEVQQLLKIYGYSTGRPDGILGQRTRNSIAEFQRDTGLEETKFIDEATWKKLNTFVRYTLVVDGNLNIKLIQEVLAAAGVEPGKIDGKMGPQTLEAVKEFQKKNNLKVDGKIGYRTLEKMSEYLVFE